MWQIYETRRFITVIWRAHRFSIYWARSIQQTTSHYIPIKSVLISTFRFSICSFSSGYPTKILYTFLLSSIYATCPTRSISLISSQRLHLVKRKILWSYELCIFLQSPITSFRNINCNTLNLYAWTPTHSKSEERRSLCCLPSREWCKWKSDTICQIK